MQIVLGLETICAIVIDAAETVGPIWFKKDPVQTLMGAPEGTQYSYTKCFQFQGQSSSIHTFSLSLASSS